jgi:hypothetical protein
MVPADLTKVECRGLPPVPVMMGMGPQGPAIGLMRPNVERKLEACALFKRGVSIISAT